MRILQSWLLTLLGVGFLTVASAHINPEHEVVGTPTTQAGANNQTDRVNFRELCDNAVAQIEQEVNNVRARLTTGGDVWWDGSDARYIVPKVPPGQPEVSSIFAGAVWLGGRDEGGNLKVAAQQYGRSSGNFDFYPGPLVDRGPDIGTVQQDTCAQWDRFFVVSGEAIDEHRFNWTQAQANGLTELNPSTISEEILGWPARGNPYFADIHGFELPDSDQGLAGFWDVDGSTTYDPHMGDYPIIEVRGCTEFEPQSSPDEMTFWIYNDAGNVHRQTDADQIRMEVQVQAFAYNNDDEINNMTFQRYKLINRAVQDIQDTYFAMWVDPDLGCYTDDYVGCDISRSLAYIYNVDQLDGEEGGCSCPQGVNTYCDEIPILGIDYFRGPLNEFGEELGMSSFTYYNNAGSDPTPLPGTTDPSVAQEYYNYLTGRWRDGEPLTTGDDGYQDGAETNYAFPDAPDDTDGWSMCTASLPVGDRRTIQASGPFLLQPGATNELIIGVVWVPDEVYPCPSLTRIREADDKAQALFDNCFVLPRGPDAPDVDWIELDRELIAVFSNSNPLSNNFEESYANRGLNIPQGVQDSLYLFEGYQLFQLSGPDVSLADRGDFDKVRPVFQVDLANGVGRLFNWDGLNPEDGETPTTDIIYVPEQQVDGEDRGIRRTFRITEDQFAEGDRRLINHKKYYFAAIAYAYNEYEEFDPTNGSGQEETYLASSRNIGDGENPYYTVLPRPTVDRELNAMYGDGPRITRIDGVGNGGNFLDITDETRAEIEAAFGGGDFSGEVTYKEGFGPIDVRVYNPLDVIDGEYELTFVDDNMSNSVLDQPVNWVLRSLSDPGAPVIQSSRPVGPLNEQIIPEYGFSVTVQNVLEPDTNPNNGSGVVGYGEEYSDPNGLEWLAGYADDTDILGGTAVDNDIFNYVLTDLNERDENIDPNEEFTNIGPGTWIPYYMADWDNRSRDAESIGFLTPAWMNSSGTNLNYRGQTPLSQLRNVDIVMTSNKDLWSRCVIIETANLYYTDELGLETRGGANMFDPRSDASVTKFDEDGDGRPDVDQSASGIEETGMGWFPGYAIDVETGQRLNIFFGENSVYDEDFVARIDRDNVIFDEGGDMMFNPSGTILFFEDEDPFLDISNFLAGGQHFVYVTKQPYDGCAVLRQRLEPSPNPLIKIAAVSEIIWAGFPDIVPGQNMLSYQNGLIPNDVTVKLRVDNSYKVEEGTGEFNGYPTYRFRLEGYQADELDMTGVENALDQINVVPNPYYGFSDYEDSQFETVVKFTNLPAKCVLTIYSLDGKFIRQYNRDEVGALPRGNALERDQINPDLEWDLKNFRGIPIASGVYLIHVSAEGLGERTLKWFGVNRQFDPSGL